MSKRKNGHSMARQMAAAVDSKGVGRVTEGTKIIRQDDFWRDPNVRRVVLPPSVREIDPYVFSRAANIEEIVLPEGLLSIGEGAFYGLRKLRRIVIPQSISIVPRGLFGDCRQLEEIIFLGPVEYIQEGSFERCCSLRRIQFAGTRCEEGTLRTPDSLVFIGSSAFRDCNSFRRVLLNPELKEVGALAFCNCKGLEEVRGAAQTKYADNFLLGCSSSLRLFLPKEIAPSQRGLYNLADANGFIRKGRRLEGYVDSGAAVVEIPEGIEVVGTDALNELSRRKEVEIRWPQSLQRIEENDALFEPGVVSHMPPGFAKPGHKLTQYELGIMKRVWADSITEETLADLYLTSTEPAASWAAERAPDPESFARRLVAMAGRKPKVRAKNRLACFFTEYADRISAELKDELQMVLSRETVPPDNSGHPYREVFLDILLKRCHLDPDDPAFSMVRAAGQRSREPHMVAPLTVKSALVPYILQASSLERDRCDLLAAKDQTAFIPAAEAEAAKADPESLAGAIGLLHDANRELHGLVYAFARYAADDQLQALVAQTGADNWRATTASRDMTPQMMLARTGALLSDTGTARELVLDAPRWTGYRERYRALHPDQQILLPRDMAYLLHGGSVFTVPGAELILAVGDEFTLEIRDKKSKKVWKLMPKKLPIAPQDMKDLELCVKYGRSWIETVSDQIEEELFNRYLSGEPLNVSWLRAIVEQPVLQKGLGQTVFQKDAVTFVFRDGKAVDADGAQVQLRDFDGIRVAHVLDADPRVMEAWREAFASKKWDSRFQQFEEPHYELSAIARDRFDGYRISLTGISDVRSRQFMFDMIPRLSASLPDGSVARISTGGRYSSEFFLGKIYLKGIDRRLNRMLYHFDQLTALPRVRKGDMSVIPFYALTGTAKLNNALREVVGTDKTELTAALLAIKESRRKKTGRKTRLSSEFAL